MIFPSPTSAALAGAGAPVALLIGVFAPAYWPVGLAWVVTVGVLVAVDAMLGADRRKLEVTLRGDRQAHIGTPTEVTAEATFGRGPKPPQRIDVQFEVNGLLKPRHRVYRSITAGNRGEATAVLDTLRRGAGMIERVWVEWTGPFGLAVKRRVLEANRPIDIIPDIRSVKKEALRIFARDTSIGQKIHVDKGGGSEFEALRDFMPGMDRRTMDWKQSARHTRLLAKEFRTEQDQTDFFAIDTGRLMCEPLGNAPKIDHAINAALLLGYVSLKMGDRVGLFGFDAKPNISTGAVSGVKSFSLLQHLASQLDYSTEETNFTLGLSQLAAEIQRRSLIVIFTDFADPTSAELMIENLGRLMKRHLVLFVAMRDAELESIMLAEPKQVNGVTRSVIAHSLITEKELVLNRLSRLGAEIINAPAGRVGPELLNRYLELKRRSRISTQTIVLRSGRFRIEREADWKRLEGLLNRVERGGPRALNDDELIEMPKLYRAALSSLSVARAISLDQALVGYLESLCARAYFFVYGARSRLGQRVAHFFRMDWPLAAQRLLPDLLVSAVAMILAGIAAYVLVINDPDWFLSFVPEDLAGGRTPAASRDFLRSTLFDGSDGDGLSVFATYLFTHNAGVSLLAFAVGFAFGLPSLVLMAYNGCVMGAFLALFGMHGLTVDFTGWLLIHGVTELLAVALAGAAGLHIGRAVAFPGRRTRLDAASEAGRQAARVMVGVILMLFIAGILEGVGRQTITSTTMRYSIAAGTGLFWMVYLFWPRRGKAGANG